MSSCGLLFVFIYSSVAVFMIVGGQSTTDDVIDINADLHSVVEEQASIIATLKAKVEKLEARQSSVMLSNRKLFSVKLCFVPCELI